MADYKGMYYTLFNSITDAVQILQTAQKNTEESYIEQEDAKVIVLDNPDTEE